jgi:fucose permease
MKIVASRYRSLFYTLFVTFVLFGTAMTVVGAVLPTMLKDFGWNYGIAGALMAAGSLGSFLAMYTIGRAVDRLGPRTVLATGFGLTAAALAAFGLTPSPVLNIALYFAFGVGSACLEVGVNWVALHMDEEGAGRPMNIMHGAFSIGAVFGPFLMGILLGLNINWTILYRGVAALFAILLAVIFFLPLSTLPRTEKREEAGPAAKAGIARYIGFAALLFYVGTELGISNWAAEYFVRAFAYTAASASFIVAVFWAGLSLGRFGIPVFFPQARPDRLLVALSILLAAAVIALAGLGGLGPAASVLAVVAVALAGLGASCVYPSVITLVGQAHQGAPGPAIGISAAGGAFGAFVFPFLMSAISTAKGVHAGFIFYAAMGVLSLVASMVLARHLASKRAAR